MYTPHVSLTLILVNKLKFVKCHIPDTVSEATQFLFVWIISLIGLSFERPFLMEGLNLMIVTFEPKTVDFAAKTAVFDEN